jgi:hypothetical protein
MKMFLKRTIESMIQKRLKMTPVVQSAIQNAALGVGPYHLDNQYHTAQGEYLELTKTIVRTNNDEISSVDDGAMTLLDIESQSPEKTYKSQVFVPFDRNVNPSCTCRFYSSLLLPCSCIAFAMGRLKKCGRIFNCTTTVHRQWAVENHPMYHQVMSQKIPPIQGMDFLPPTTQDTVTELQKVHVPKNEKGRRSALSSLASKISSIAVTEPFIRSLVFG